jgi:hypothetical protein
LIHVVAGAVLLLLLIACCDAIYESLVECCTVGQFSITYSGFSYLCDTDWPTVQHSIESHRTMSTKKRTAAATPWTPATILTARCSLDIVQVHCVCCMYLQTPAPSIKCAVLCDDVHTPQTPASTMSTHCSDLAGNRRGSEGGR